MTTADLIRLKLAELRTLDPRQADEVERDSPLTLNTLNDPDNHDIDGLPFPRTAGQLRAALNRELDERLQEARALGEAAAV